MATYSTSKLSLCLPWVFCKFVKREKQALGASDWLRFEMTHRPCHTRLCADTSSMDMCRCRTSSRAEKMRPS